MALDRDNLANPLDMHVYCRLAQEMLMPLRFDRHVSLFVGIGLLSLGILGACAQSPADPNDPAKRSSSEQAAAAATSIDDPYPGVNTVARDRDVWIELMHANASIRRTVRHTEQGVEALTESDDPAVAAKIIDHAHAMQARMKVGAQVRVWDPVFAELFRKHGHVNLEVTPTEKGVRIVESSADPEARALLRAHAMGVSEFVREGIKSMPRETARFSPDSPLPAPELAIGGVPHRIILTQPDGAQLGSLKSAGVDVVISFREPSESPEFDEQAAASSVGMAFCNLPYAGAADLNDEILDSARAAIKAADEKGETAALHCRTGNRVGPAWAAYRALDKGVPVEQAINEARAMQMIDPQLEDKARDYIRRRAAATAQ